MVYERVNKTLNWGVKVASLAVTGPATWVVASELFSDIQQPALLFLMQFSAVFLIEGVMLSNWLLLEFDKQATPEIKARYGLTALAMYIALLVIAWKHEGPAGLVFRIALLAALIGSGWDTYVYTWQKATAKADKDVWSTGKVRRQARKLAQEEAIAERKATNEVTLARIAASKEGDLLDVRLYGERLSLSIQHADQQERSKIQAEEVKISTGDEYLRGQIAKAFAKDSKYPRVQLAQELGVGTTKLYEVMNGMVGEGILRKENGGYHVFASNLIRNNGNG